MNAKKIMEPVDMEARLEKAFRPVHPSRKFVQTVRGRIRRLSPPVVVASRLDETPRLLLVIGGVISAALLLAASLRAVFYVLNKSKM
jgi:hypothetical protein